MQKKSEIVAALLAKGLTPTQVIAKKVASAPYVYAIANGAVQSKRRRTAAKRVAEALPAPKGKRGRKAGSAKRLKRIERYALALARELAKTP